MQKNKTKLSSAYPFAELPDPASLKIPPSEGSIPDTEYCLTLWDKYGMLSNIRAHSWCVAKIAEGIAIYARKQGFPLNAPAVLAAGLLHDIAKTWCLTHKGSHASIGASWVVMETGNYAIAQGVILHVHWPWQLPQGQQLLSLPILVQYADKRVRHDQCVSLDERFDDLIIRYGKTEAARTSIRTSLLQARLIEQGLSRLLGCNLAEINPATLAS